MPKVDRSIWMFFLRGVVVSLARPRQALQMAGIAGRQLTAARIRRSWRKRGVKVPPIIIFSITHQCNLNCAGCYAHSFTSENAAYPAVPGEGVSQAVGGSGTESPAELSDEKLSAIVAEAVGLGVSFFVVAGGEPFMRDELLAIAGRFPRAVFLVFTNGLLLDAAMVDRIAGLKNVVPLVSLEGSEAQTDERRGEGTYAQSLAAMARMRGRRLFFGCSLTLTSHNFATVFSADYMAGLDSAGCRFFLFLDYTPVDSATQDWVLSPEQRGQVGPYLEALRREYKALFIAVPWDEADVGGCLSAGRGFVHVSASGAVEPCPFAPYSDSDLMRVSLRQALESPFLAKLRDSPELSEYKGAGCALWRNREKVEELLADSIDHAR